MSDDLLSRLVEDEAKKIRYVAGLLWKSSSRRQATGYLNLRNSTHLLKKGLDNYDPVEENSDPLIITRRLWETTGECWVIETTQFEPEYLPRASEAEGKI